MLFSRILVSSRAVSPAQMTEALLQMEKAGWTPALIDAGRTLLTHAGVTEAIPVAPLRRRSMFGDAAVAGDLFFRHNDVFFIVSEQASDGRLYGRLSVDDDEEEEPEASRLTIGVLSSKQEGLSEALQDFSDLAEHCVETATHDSTESDSQQFEWAPEVSGARLAAMLTAAADESNTAFTRAELTAATVNGTTILQDKAARELLISVAQAGFAREQDILTKKQTDRASSIESLNSLVIANLLNTEYMLECKSTNLPLTRLVSKEQLDTAEVQSLVCPNCNAHFSDERVVTGYSLSELGRSLSQRSHWMTVWVTRLLVDLGVNIDSIVWNVSDSGEEVDMLVEFLDNFWVFELKDRDFSTRDAYPLNYRRAKYGATLGIIVSTDKVQREAQRILTELAEESMRPSRVRPPQYVFIEGLESARNLLQTTISDASMLFALRRLVGLEDISGYRVREIVRMHFQE